MNTALSIAESYGNLASNGTDIPDLLKRVHNSWIDIYLSLFTNLLDKHTYSTIIENPDPSEGGFSSGIYNVWYKEAVLPSLSLTLDKIRSLREDNYGSSRFKADLSSELDFIDLTKDVNTRISNPVPIDVLPLINIVDYGIWEKQLIKTGGIPNVSGVPVIYLHPSIRGIHRFERVYRKFGTTERLFDDSPDKGSLLEISIFSIIEDLKVLLKGYDISTKILAEESRHVLYDVVCKYADITVALIAIGLRADHNQSEAFIREVYERYTKNHMGALYFQKQLYELTQILLQSGLGIQIARFYAFQYSVSTFDLLNTTSKYHYLLEEVLHETLGSEVIGNFRKYIGNVPESSVNAITETITDEQDAINTISCRMILLIIDVLMKTERDVSRQADSSYSDLRKIVDELSRELEIHPVPYQYDELAVNTVRKLNNLINRDTLGIFGERILKATGKKPIPTPLRYSNDAQPLTNQSWNDEYVTGAYIFQGNSTASESCALAKEVFRNKYSNAAISELESRLSSVMCYEDALSIYLDCEAYIELLKHSPSVREENADTEIFKRAVYGASSAMKDLMGQYKASLS
jgi:hypothetical protein